MMQSKIGLGILYSVNMPPTEQLKLFKEIGFDAFFSDYNPEEIPTLRKLADELGMIYQSVHAPFYRMNHLWEQTSETDSALYELINCVYICKKYEVPIMVVHPFIGFDKNTPTELGIENFRKVVDIARDSGVKIAFENVEGEAYLEALMNEFKDYDNVGFCWDAGHEMCYNRSKDMLAIYGDRLIATHINDNMGVSGEEITFHDDLHLLPFDGIKDWGDAMARMKKCGYNDILTFELKISKEIDEKYGTDYSDLEVADYLKKTYERCVKVKDLFDN